MNNNIDRVSAAAALLMLVTWAMPGIFIRFLPELTIAELAAWRLIPAVVPIALVMMFSPRLRAAFGNIVSQPLVLMASTFMMGYYVISNLGFRNAPVAIVALLISLAPVWVMIFERISGRRLSDRQLAGAALAFIGLFICLWPGLSGLDGRVRLVGIIASIASSLLSAGFVIIMRLRNNGDSYQPLAVSFLIFLLGIPLLGLSHAFGTPFGVSNLDSRGLYTLLTLGLVSTATPTLCYAILGSRLPPVATALMNLLVPPCAALAAWFILGEYISWLVILGGSISLSGLLLVVTGKSRNTVPA